MSEPKTSKHASLLNELDAMQQTPMYALRRGTLQQAELVIVQQEDEINKLKGDYHALIAKFNQLNIDYGRLMSEYNPET